MDAVIPIEASDAAHPDHEAFVRRSGHCFAEHDGECPGMVAKAAPPRPGCYTNIISRASVQALM